MNLEGFMRCALKFFTLNDFEIKNKRVLVRVDLNSPIDPETGRLLEVSKISKHSETILELIKKGAKTVLITHQGSKSSVDFTNLRQHAELLEEVLGRRVNYVDDIFGSKAKEAIVKLKEGDVLLLENLRMWDGEAVDKPPEEHAKSQMVKELAPLFDLFINDAFGTAHRSHASMVGFTYVLPSAAGRLMEREIKILENIVEGARHPVVFVMGGSKVEDVTKVGRNVLDKGIADVFLTGGVAAMVMSVASGVNLGSVNMKFLKDRGSLELIDEVQELLEKHEDGVRIPIDYAVETLKGERFELPISSFPYDAPIMDIGCETSLLYGEDLLKAKTTFMSGPMGVFEKGKFRMGTAYIFHSIITSNALSIIGGGHTVASAKLLNVANKFSHVSTGGGALTAFLAEMELPAVKALERVYFRAGPSIS